MSKFLTFRRLTAILALGCIGLLPVAAMAGDATKSNCGGCKKECPKSGDSDTTKTTKS